jgi:hypothetical protein
MRKAPSACGEAPGAGGSEEESGQILRQIWMLLRRLCCQQAEPTEFFVGENHLLAAVTRFQVSDTSNTGKTPNFGCGEAEEYGGAVFPDLLLDIHGL